MRPGAPAPWRFSHRGQDPGLLTLREILDSGRCRAKGRIAAASSQGQVADVDPLVLVPGADWAYAIAVGVAAVIACGPGMKEDSGKASWGSSG